MPTAFILLVLEYERGILLLGLENTLRISVLKFLFLNG